MEEEQPFEKKDVLRYYAHGLLFSLLSLIAGFVSIFFIAALVVVGSILGLIIGLIVLIVLCGWINAVLTSWLWKVNIKTKLLSLFGHGLSLILLFLVAAIPNLIIVFLGRNSSFSIPESTYYLSAIIISFTIYPFIDGYIARSVAEWWKREADEDDNDISPPSASLPP